jgi:hypothetical protein
MLPPLSLFVFLCELWRANISMLMSGEGGRAYKDPNGPKMWIRKRKQSCLKLDCPSTEPTFQRQHEFF